MKKKRTVQYPLNYNKLTISGGDSVGTQGNPDVIGQVIGQGFDSHDVNLQISLILTALNLTNILMNLYQTMTQSNLKKRDKNYG